MSAYFDSVFEPAFSKPAPVSAKKYRNGSRNRGFPSVYVRFHPYPEHVVAGEGKKKAYTKTEKEKEDTDIALVTRIEHGD
jgi:hypothetical protein